MSPAPRPQAGVAQHLSPQTLAWLADRPHASKPVHWVWTTLTELERANHHPGALGALRSILLDHQPLTRTGRCRTCRRFSWRRRPFPCAVWMTIHFKLQGLFNGSTPLTSPQTVAAHSDAQYQRPTGWD